MSNKKRKILLSVVCPLSSAFVLILSFPDFNLWPLAWVGLIPLLFAVEGKKPLQAFLISSFIGVLFYLGTIYWLIHVTFPGMVILVSYLALYFGLFGLVVNRALAVNHGPGTVKGIIKILLGVPAAWVALEYIRSNLLTGMGWALLGYSQYTNLVVIQIADTFGTYGVSFLIVMVNAGIYMAIKGLRPNGREIKRPFFLAPFSLPVIFIAPFLFLTLAYGTYRLNNIFTGPSLRVSVIQGNIPQSDKWQPEYRNYIMSRYEALAGEAAKDKPDVIIWPETAVPGYFEEKEIEGWTKSLVAKIGIPHLVGVPRVGGNGLFYNSAVFLSAKGDISSHYDKLHLVPFGEYIPFKRVLSFVERFAPAPIGDFTKGAEYTVFRFKVERDLRTEDEVQRLVKAVKFSCLICFEDIFPGLVRHFVKNGADFLVNITNDAWFKKTSAPYQHAQASVFRAVENRVNVVRAANTGLSCFIDQKGRIKSTVRVGGDELFVEGWKTHEIILAKTRTFYTIYGDIFALFSAIVAAYCLIRLV